MSIEQRLSEMIKDQGISICKIAEKSGVRYSILQPALKGRRPLKAGEFFAVCAALNVEPNTFKIEKGVQRDQ